jgi:hypothetical protein
MNRMPAEMSHWRPTHRLAWFRGVPGQASASSDVVLGPVHRCSVIAKRVTEEEGKVNCTNLPDIVAVAFFVWLL